MKTERNPCPTCGAHPESSQGTIQRAALPVLICRERDGECPTPAKCRERGCPLEKGPATCNPQEAKP